MLSSQPGRTSAEAAGGANHVAHHGRGEGWAPELDLGCGVGESRLDGDGGLFEAYNHTLFSFQF